MGMREDAVAIARRAINTRFVHLGREFGVAVDCIGLAVCTCWELGTLPRDVDFRDYTQSPDVEEFTAICDAHMRRKDEIELGDLVAILVKGVGPHVGIVGDYYLGGWSIIHASNSPLAKKDKRVVETRLVLNRYFRLISAYALPGID